MVTELADGVFQLTPLPYMNVTAVRGADGWTLVDAGIAGLAQRLARQLFGLGVRRGRVERIVLTHGHFDHAGGAARLRDAFGVTEVLVGRPDLDPVRVGAQPSGGIPDRLPMTHPPLPGAAAVSGPIDLGDGRTLVPVATPGHTAGHVSYHLPASGVVLGGDAVFNVFRLRPAPGFLCADAAVNAASVETLASLAPSTLQLAHGSPVTGDVAGRLRALATG